MRTSVVSLKYQRVASRLSISSIKSQHLLVRARICIFSEMARVHSPTPYTKQRGGYANELVLRPPRCRSKLSYFYYGLRRVDQLPLIQCTSFASKSTMVYYVARIHCMETEYTFCWLKIYDLKKKIAPILLARDPQAIVRWINALLNRKLPRNQQLKLSQV